MKTTLRSGFWLIAAALLALAGCEGGGVSSDGQATGGDAADATVGDAAPATDAAPDDTTGAASKLGTSAGTAAITGGTLAVSADGAIAVVADVERDRVSVVRLADQNVTNIALQPHDEPGRVVFGPPGVAFVGLRRGGAVARIDVDKGVLLQRRPVCGDVRGLAWDAAKGSLHVACATGELVTLPADDGPEKRRLFVADDLRDVAIVGSGLQLTRFRSAQVMRIDADGKFDDLFLVPSVQSKPGAFTPSVAWRMRVLADGRTIIAHQRGLNAPIGLFEGQGGYTGGTCKDGVVHSSLAVLAPNGASITKGALGSLFQMPLVVDVAVSADGKRVAAAAAGSTRVTVYAMEQILASKDEHCFFGDGNLQATGFGVLELGETPVAVEFVPGSETLLVQTRAPMLVVYDGKGETLKIALGGEKTADPGHDLFHRATIFGMACAGCHPEGREDGRVWTFEPLGKLRTQSLWGGLASTAPYHWNADFADLGALMDDVFVQRMGGEPMSPDAAGDLLAWLDKLPVPAAAPGLDAALVAKGKALFESTGTGCASCHSGPRFTDNQSYNVGTSMGPLQVPSLLGVGARLPLMHDGCASTLKERFSNTACGGGDKHGTTSKLDAEQVAALVAYLASL
ncbi:MAG: c-type cytochrome [Deltaproteobacteria bacterium]|nr:c-type cytochrome [Deltaproteobacteria bacterium]